MFIRILQVLAVVSSTATIFMLGVEVLTFGYYMWTFSMWLLLIPVLKKDMIYVSNVVIANLVFIQPILVPLPAFPTTLI